MSGTDLALAWPRVGVHQLAGLLSQHIDQGWRATGAYASGPCPMGVGKCAGDPGVPDHADEVIVGA